MADKDKMTRAIEHARVRYEAGVPIAWAVREGLAEAGIQQNHAGGPREFFGSPEYLEVRAAVLGEGV